MLTGSQLNPMRLVPTTGKDAWKQIPFPAKGKAINWGSRIALDNNPLTSPHGEPSTTTEYVIVWDGAERHVSVEAGNTEQFNISGADIPVWPVRADKWHSSHGNVGIFVIDKGAEDTKRHKLEFYTVNKGKGGEIVNSNRCEFLVD